jgi:hypothetical protein
MGVLVGALVGGFFCDRHDWLKYIDREARSAEGYGSR